MFWKRRSIWKNIGFWWMPMKIKEKFYPFTLLSPTFFEIPQNASQLKKNIFPHRILISIPMSVEVITQKTSSVVAQHNSIDIDHRNNNPSEIIGRCLQSIDKSLHHPWSDSLPGMLSSNNYNKGLAIVDLIDQKSINFMTQDTFTHLYRSKRYLI